MSLFNLGGFNEWPPNMEPSTASAFWQSVDMWGYGVIEHREPVAFRALEESDPTYPDRPASVYVHAYCDGTGFVVAMIQKESGLEQRFFTFAACDHDYIMTRERVCYSEHRCQKCGYVKTVDSS